MTSQIRNHWGLFMGQVSDNSSCKLAYAYDMRYLGQYIKNIDITYDSDMRIVGSGDLTTTLIYEYAREHGHG